MIVLDTNVLSEVLRPVPESSVMDWLAIQPRVSLFTTAVTVSGTDPPDQTRLSPADITSDFQVGILGAQWWRGALRRARLWRTARARADAVSPARSHG